MDSDSEHSFTHGVEEEEEENVVNGEIGEPLDVTESELLEVAEGCEEKNLGLKFPLGRVKRIMKADPDLQLASQDAVFLITKATVSYCKMT